MDLYVADEATGRRTHRRRSTKTRNFKIAEPIARRTELELSEGRLPAATLTAKARAELRTPILPAVEQFVDSRRVDGYARKTLLKYGQVPRAFAAFLLEKHDVATLEGIVARHADLFKAHRKDVAGLDDYTVYTELTVVKTWLKWCVQRDLIQANPFAAIAASKPRNRRRHPAATLDQVDAVLKLACGTRFALLALLAFTGLRVGEAAGLRPEDVDLQASLIHVRPARGRL